MRFANLLLLGIVVALFLFIRTLKDRKQEKVFDKEIVREGEEYLGQWAGRYAEAFFYFRLKRDGSFISKRVPYGQADTIYTNGRYDIIEGQSTAYYPRLLTLAENGDTLFNFYLASVTPYDTKVMRVDRLVFQPNSLYDTVSFVFYRVK